MKADYDDIKDLTTKEPKWFDSNGVPRYCVFHPERSPNIYADEVALLEIQCQACEERFQVEVYSDRSIKATRREWAFEEDEISLEDQVKKESISYGDPPIHRCFGDTMTTSVNRVLQFWTRKTDWFRVPELEVAIVGEDK